MIKILIVEDDLDLGDLLKQYLELNKFDVQRVFNGIEAREILKEQSFNILILDVMMPKEDGFTLAQKLQIKYPDLPFLFVTARKMKEDILTGLKLGADDYITKPFDADELILRIQNILKRKPLVKENKSETYSIGKFIFEPKNLLLKTSYSEKYLTEKEAQLLEYLYKNKDCVIRREDILNHLWEETDFFSGRSLDVFISRLRKYLSEDKSIQIESLRSVGYRFIIT
ncbi:response regulator transcription factor [Galbibacter orientalis]|uniref:Response regulator with CheY-like receiver domain and winged-helix DNA-binding domain n=1 Tax=Galbibacter orientalis DSM 19592 TaxID=926559 RepID=I3C2Y6_9FLAO|nr:response regulator transcription factor [Galbibacter orientalis]EIJ37979.1 response regulator with CheY-like receiver domain and winged-helix DNA-binding domain [Galbibacter orientalis DSM 19592]